MNHQVARRILLWLAVSLALLAGGCRAAPPPPPAGEIVSRAVEGMAAQEGFSFSIDRSGGPAYLDANKTLSFRRAEGAYAAPDQAAATVRVIVPGLVAEVRMVAIGERYWETNFLTGEWVEVPAGQAFNPAALFDAARGLPAILARDLHTLSFVGEVELEELPGLSLYHVVGDLETTELFPLSFGLIGPEPARLQMWVDPESFAIHRLLIIETPAPEAEATVWQVDFWDFGVVESIEPP